MRTTQLVMTVTLDWLAARFPAPDVIKIDVEEAELAVLAGGPLVLRQCPVVICEVAGQNADAVADLLAAGGYQIYDGDQRPGERRPLAAAPYNTLAMCPAGIGRAAERRSGAGLNENGGIPHA